MPCVGPCQPALSFGQLENVWISNGGALPLAPLMAAIALAESGGVPNNTNPTDNHGTQTSWGLWQVSNGTHAAYPNWSDPNANAKVAVAKQKTQGLTAWGTYSSGAAQRILAANGGGTSVAGSLPAIPALPGVVGPPSVTGEGPVDTEGEITMPSVIPNISRRWLRRVVGGAVLATGGIVGLAGVFILVGGKAPGPAQIVQGAIQARTGRKASRAAGAVAQTTPDELAERRAARGRESRGRTAEGRSRSARAEGERAAAAAGDF
jgi:hypothetical protein